MVIPKKLAKIEGYILSLCTLVEPFEASCRDAENFISGSSSEEDCEQKACIFLLKCIVTIPESGHYSNDLDLRSFLLWVLFSFLCTDLFVFIKWRFGFWWNLLNGF